MKHFKSYLLLLCYLMCFCAGQEIDKLINKICVIARDKIHVQDYTPQERQQILETMKEKLMKASKGFETSAYIRLIIQGVTVLSDEVNYQKLCKDQIADAKRRNVYNDMFSTKILGNESIFTSATRTSNITPSSTIETKLLYKTSTSTRQPLAKSDSVKELSNKMEMALKKQLQGLPTLEEKVKKVGEVKRRFLTNFQKVQIASNASNIHNKTKLLETGIDLAIKKVLGNETLRSIEANKFGGNPKDKRSHHKPPAHSTPEFQKVENIALTTIMDITTDSTSNYTTTVLPIEGLTKEYSCSNILKEACTGLKNLDKFICAFDSTTLTMSQVCDGHIDCPDGSDERNCIQQIIIKIQGATEVMSQLELNQYCFRSIIDNSLLARQSELLSYLLNTQIKFLKQYTDHFQKANGTKPLKARRRSAASDDIKRKMETFFKKYHYEEQVNLIVNEVAILIRSFGTTLVGALCTIDNEDLINKIEKITNLELILKEEPEVPLGLFSPRSCECSGHFCTNVTSCDPKCKRYCYHVANLAQFSCKSMKRGQNGISLDLICDGKLDCYDKADETNCPVVSVNNSGTKFKISRAFDKIISYLNEQTLNEEYEPARPILVQLGGAIQKLHKQATSAYFNIDSYRIQRNRCFDLLKETYTTMLEGLEGHEMQEKAYGLLSELNKKLIEAMRLTHFGNHKVIAPDECYCRGPVCGTANCSTLCVRSCIVKDTLTRYTCNGTNITIPIQALCNGKIDCPTGEDEINCNADICRKHHLKVLRVNIQDLLEKHKMSTMGGMLYTWRDKVFSELTNLENETEKLTPKVLKTTVYQILNDLSVSFLDYEKEALKSYPESSLKKFKLISQSVAVIVKECNK